VCKNVYFVFNMFFYSSRKWYNTTNHLDKLGSIVVVTDMAPFPHMLDPEQLCKSGAEGRPGPNLQLQLLIFVIDILFLNYFLFLDAFT
jgi:hypothetical protein